MEENSPSSRPLPSSSASNVAEITERSTKQRILASPSLQREGGTSNENMDNPSSIAGGGVAVTSTVGGKEGSGIINTGSNAASSNSRSSTIMNWEPIRSRLLGNDLEESLAAAMELREGIEIVHTTEFPLLLSALLPAFSTILTNKTSPTPDTTSTQHKLRNTILELLSRMPSNEVLRPHAPHLVAVALDVLNRDYEDNALLATKIIFDLYKVFRTLPQDYVQPFLNFAVAAFRNLPNAVQHTFSFQTLMSPSAQATVSTEATTSPSGTTVSELQQGNPAVSNTTTPVKSSTPPSEKVVAEDIIQQTKNADVGQGVDTPDASATRTSNHPNVSEKVSTPIKKEEQHVSTESARQDLMSKAVVTETPASKLAPAPLSSNKASSSPMSPPRPSPRSLTSFKVLTECPLIVMLMFQLYPKFLRGNIPTLINVMMEALSLRVPSIAAIEHRQKQQQQRQQVANTNDEAVSTPMSIEHHRIQQKEPAAQLTAIAQRVYFSRSRELAAAQSKTLSFLTYLLRGFPQELKPYEDRLAANVVAIMSSCARELLSTRKELLVATRHFLNSDFRNGFFRHIDALLDEKVLLGSHSRSHSEQCVLRPLGYAVLSDLIHHVRGVLTLSQISKIVSVFSKVVHDESLPSSTQYTAVRTLLSVVDSVFQAKDRDIQKGRDILVRVFRTLVEKLSSLKSYPFVDELQPENDLPSREQKQTSYEPCTSFALNTEEDVGKGRINIIRAIVVGAKTLIWYINNYRVSKDKERPETIQARLGTKNSEVYSGLSRITQTEQDLIDEYVVLALPTILSMKNPSSGETNLDDIEKTASEQYRDTLTYFAAAFTSLDGTDLRKIMGPRLEMIVDAVQEDQTTIIIPRHLLSANAATSFELCTMMLNFLVTRMDNLAVSKEEGILFLSVVNDGDDPSSGSQIERIREVVEDSGCQRNENRQKVSNAHLQLFERVLKSLSSYPENEGALRPHLKTIVSTCLRCCLENTEYKTDNYCMLLRYIFRSISAGKFEESYRELLPLIPAVLSGLYRVLLSSQLAPLRHTLIELVLTIPARLSSLLPHINLLLRVIVLSLESSSDDLVNLGLRTLEFWVDNLNPEFLFPEISKEMSVYVSVMKALSTHLRPAPYPYGLLTLRLLGKLGGKNRRVLRDPMEVQRCAPAFESLNGRLTMDFTWKQEQETIEDPDAGMGSLSIPVSLEKCLDLLKKASFIHATLSSDLATNTNEGSVGWNEWERIMSCDIEKVDMVPLCKEVVQTTISSQVEAALQVLRASLLKMTRFENDGFELIGFNDDPTQEDGCLSPDLRNHTDMRSITTRKAVYNHRLETIVLGMLHGCMCNPDEISFVKGFVSEVFCLVSRNQESILRVDASGSSLETDNDDKEDMNLGSLRPFGYFEMTGELDYSVNPFVFNRAVARFLSRQPQLTTSVGLDLLKFMVNLPMAAGQSKDSANEKSGSLKLDRGSEAFFENLLSCICEQCVHSDWSSRGDLHSALCIMVETLGWTWGRKYENEIMNVALFSVKSSPREVSIAGLNSFRFLTKMCCCLYGVPPFMQIVSESQPLTFDLLSPWRKKTPLETPAPSDQSSNASKTQFVACPNDDVVQMLLIELASTKNLTRNAARYVLDHYLFNAQGANAKAKLGKHLAVIRRVLFSRSLRLLPLPEQVGVVEGLAVITDQIPDLVPLDDQHLLAFLSELLKMASVADGEMTDPNLIGSVVDRNGFVVPSEDRSDNGEKTVSNTCSFRASSLFLRRECVVDAMKGKIVVGAELAVGVQFRVSTIALLRSVIRGHPDIFFDSETTTPVGNIRPHVISLLFRSLVSQPVRAVSSAHDALRDVLTLSVVSTPGPEGAKSKSRLRKELLQTCIRPVLLSLREYTKLDVVLLRGLEQLLSLLSSWFNKTLGEKLLDHLQKWTDPNRIKSQKLWVAGREPDVPAAIIGLFVLLPQASNFVDHLVKTTIKLEAVLPAYKSQYVASPFRKPLAKYLNKYCQYTVAFFLQRLRTPIYSEIFLDVVNLDESRQLREYLSGRQCSVSLLNICFERPLAIIRSEKASVGTSPPGVSPGRPGNSEEVMALHGILPFSGQQENEAVLLHEVESRQKQLKALQQDLAKWKEAVSTKGGKGSNATAETKAQLDEARKQLRATRVTCDKISKELVDVRKRYADAVAKKKAAQTDQSSQDPRPMNIDSLELQLQGFRLVEALVKSDPMYLRDHTDVLRAFRWLWRSKGRYLRMQFEECIPPRYQGESKTLAKFLVNYAGIASDDVDLLFELIRIFLQPSTSDFLFVRRFLSLTASVALNDERKKSVLDRFFALMAGESTEEIKTLSLRLVVYPMLRSSLSGFDGHFDMSSDVKGDSSLADKPRFLDSSVIQKFVSEVLYDEHGKANVYSDKLKVGLLQVADVLLHYVPRYFGSESDQMMKYCRVLMKSEDTCCKNWAYYVMCRFITSLETPRPTVFQVFSLLLRMHQPDKQDRIRSALDLLVSALPRVLDAPGLQSIVSIAQTVMFEEANSIAQLAHVFHVIVKQPHIFVEKRGVLASFMINSLNRLGLPPNSPSENRALAVSIVDLVIHWEGNINVDLRKPEGNLVTDCVSLDKSATDSIANFLIRLKLLLADPKVETCAAEVQLKIDFLLKEVIARWPGILVRPAYFDKIVSMCNDDKAILPGVLAGEQIEKEGTRTPGKGITSSGKGISSTGKSMKGDGGKSTTSLVEVVLACVEVFKFLVVGDPENVYLSENPTQIISILGACFRMAEKPGETNARAALSDFLSRYLSMLGRPTSSIDERVVRSVQVWLETTLVSSELGYRTAPSRSSGDLSRQSRPRQSPSGIDSVSEQCNTVAALRIIKMATVSSPAFSKSFIHVLLNLLNTIVKRHTLQAASRQKQNGVSYDPHAGTISIRQMYPTPTFGILEEAEMAATQSLVGVSRTPQPKHSVLLKDLDDFDETLQSAVLTLDVLKESDVIFHFSALRKSFVSLLQSILDMSNNLQLLLSAVRIVGHWLLAGDSGPLTVKERGNFMAKMASFDFNGLSEVVSQPFFEVVCHLVKQISSSSNTPDREDDAIIQSVTACVLTTKSDTRDIMIELFRRTCRGEVRRNGPVESLDLFLRSNLHGIGGRFWVTLLVELLLDDLTPPKNYPEKNENLSMASQKMDIMSDHDADFLASWKKEVLDMRVGIGARRSASALRQLAHGDPRICHDLLETLLPTAWGSVVDHSMALSLTEAAASILSQPFHTQSFKNDTPFTTVPQNAVKTFLSVFVRLSPLPLVDVDLLLFLARSYNCWYETLSILENQFLVLSTAELSKSGKCERDKLLMGMRYCYRELGECNVWTTLALKSCAIPGSQLAASLEIYGRVDKATDGFTSLIELVDSEEGCAATNYEIDFWEERWVDLQQQQQQHDVITEYATQSSNERIMLECAWRERSWDKVRFLCSTPPVVAAVETGDPAIKICETLSAVADGKLGDVENLHAQASQLALYRWEFLPSLSSGSGAHAQLLHYFHRLVEIRESGQIMVETNNHSNGKTLPDLKNLLNAWRHRLPNDNENLNFWDEIFTWRSHMFSAITSNFHWSEPSTLATLHDRPWTAIKMASVARKQGMRETSLLLLNRLTESRAMDVSDAYQKLREQILFYNNPESELERTGGLNLINTTNLSYFDSTQKAELFRLKAIFLASLRRTSKSNQAYCHSVQICPTHAKSWISWGGLCSSLGAMTEKQADQSKSVGDNQQDTRAAATKKVAQYLAQAMGCFIEAVQIDTNERSRIHLPKVLWMLTKDGSGPGVLCQTLENRGTKLPPWVWLPWVPQMLTGLCRIEGRSIRSLLSRLVKAYPQAVYYSLRSFYLERRDVERAKGPNSNPGQHMDSVAFAEEMMSTLRRSHASLWSSLEAILEELIVKFRPSYEEELLATISALLERAESHAEKQSLPDKKRAEDEEALVSSWTKTLGRIAAKFFKDAADPTSSTSNRRDERVKKTSEFKRKYKKDFEEDFKVSSSDAGANPSTETDIKSDLRHYVTKLQSWKEKLEAQVSRTPVSLPLIESSHALAMYHGDIPDLWPGSCDTKYSTGIDNLPSSDDPNSRSHTSSSSSAAIARKAALNAAGLAANAAAREGIGGEYGGGSAAIEIPGQYCPNFSTSSDVRPSPELHTHLVKFEPFVQVLRRHDQLVRRCGMIGSDGKTYRFLLQFAIPHWTRSDERTSQTWYVMDKFLRRNPVAARHYISVQPSPAIPVAQRLRMTPDFDTRLALEDVLRVNSCDWNSVTDTSDATYFLEEVTKRLKERISRDSLEEDKIAAEMEVRQSVFQKLCNLFQDKVLLRFLQRVLGSAEGFFLFRRTLSVQLAANSLLQYVFTVAERTPQRFVMLLSNARMMSPDFRISYSNQGFIESSQVPFRMTPNVEAALGEHYIQGIFVRSMAMIAGAAKQHKEEFDPILRLLMRDDILSWYTKSQAKTDSKTQELERQLIERVSKNVYTVQSRIAECTPSSKTSSDLKSSPPLDQRVNDLLLTATDPAKLCMMSTSYRAWL